MKPIIPAKSTLSGEVETECLRGTPLRFVCGWRGRVQGYFPMHSHRVVELVYHPSGSGVTTLSDGRKIGFEPHGTVIYPALAKHDQRMSSLGDDICLHVEEPEGIRLFPETLYIPPGGTETKRVDRFVRTEFLHLSQVRSDPGRQLELDLRITALVVRLLQLNKSSARDVSQRVSATYLDRACQYISENYTRIDKVSDIAHHVGVSEDYLRHIFLEHGGTSLNRLLTQTRIERVKELLINSRLPIKAIAAMAGFETERYLSTRFKKVTGMSPGAFRREAVLSTERGVGLLSDG